MARVTLRRGSDSFGKVRKLKVLADGVEVGRLLPGRHVEIDLPAGRHEFTATMDWTRGAPLVVDVTDAAPVAIEFSMPFWKAMVYTFVRPGRVVQIRRV